MYHTMIEHQREENREKGYTCFVLPTENMMHPIALYICGIEENRE